MTIGINIRKTRRALGMTQGEFAAKMEVSQGAVSNWERGIDKPGLKTLFVLADITGDKSFISHEALINKMVQLPKLESINASPLIDGLLDIVSRIEALEQSVKLLQQKKKARA